MFALEKKNNESLRRFYEQVLFLNVFNLVFKKQPMKIKYIKGYYP